MRKLRRMTINLPPIPMEERSLSSSLQENLKLLQTRVYDRCSDVIYRTFLLGGAVPACLVYVDGLSDPSRIEEHVILPLQHASPESFPMAPEALMKRYIPVAQAQSFTTMGEAAGYLAAGFPLLLFEGEATALAVGLNKWVMRGVQEPSAEAGIRGPREGYTETMQTNTSQLRRIIKSPRLKLETLRIGAYTQTLVTVAYIEGLADPELIQEIRSRLERIRIDGILESEYIEEMIEDHPYSPFPQILSTERPDVTAAALLEGRAAILTEGTPFALIAPVTFFSLIQSQEDYYQRFLTATFIRWLRYGFLLMSMLLPSFYVAILNFHQEMVPGPLLISMASSRESVPFPALIEALIMEVTFEALREAGVRLPKQVGAAVSIVGALVIGQAAVQAGLVSAPMVIIVAITGIASFMAPRYATGVSLRILRFPLIFLAGTFGLLGTMMGIIAIVIHMVGLRSFGLPYLSTIGTPRVREMKDVLVRAPWWRMRTRPRFAGSRNSVREDPDLKPGPDPDHES